MIKTLVISALLAAGLMASTPAEARHGGGWNGGGNRSWNGGQFRHHDFGHHRGIRNDFGFRGQHFRPRHRTRTSVFFGFGFPSYAYYPRYYTPYYPTYYGGNYSYYDAPGYYRRHRHNRDCDHSDDY